MEERHCVHCGKKLPCGSLVYVAQVKVFADFDGVILEEEHEAHAPLEQLLEQIKNDDPKTLEKEVYEEFRLVLCKRCRDRFVDETRHPWEDSLSMKGSNSIFH